MPPKLIAALTACALLSACATAPRLPPAATTPEFRPERYFLGEMHSTGQIRLGLAAPQPLHVDSHGHATGEDALALDQVVHRAGAPDAHRTWTMRRLSDGRYAVTLTEAAGPVWLEATGARVHLHYRLRKGALPTTLEQWMDLAPDGRTVHNVGVFRVLGVPVGRLDETIVREG